MLLPAYSKYYKTPEQPKLHMTFEKTHYPKYIKYRLPIWLHQMKYVWRIFRCEWHTPFHIFPILLQDYINIGNTFFYVFGKTDTHTDIICSILLELIAPRASVFVRSQTIQYECCIDNLSRKVMVLKLDESTARRQLKSPRSLTGRSIHLTLVTKWSWSWSWMTYCHPLCTMSIGPPKFDHENPWSRSCVRSKVKVSFDLQNSKVKIMVKVKHIGHIWGLEFNLYVFFLLFAIGPLLADI